MLAAASMGATAFQKGLGGVHAIAHPVGSWFNTHHGLTNAVILPYIMTFNRNAIAEKTDVIARVLDLPERGFDGFLAWVLAMRRELGIPHSLAAIGVSADKASIIGREAAIDPSAGGNPIPVNAAQLEHVFRAAVNGRLDAVESAP
jgi:alcohol dehydrogenase class IV